MPRTWFVTGAARGIGGEIVKAALNAGDRVVATGRTTRNIEQSFRAESDRLLVLPLDVTDDDQIRAAVDAAVEEFGGIDVLVNNAGYGQLGVFEETRTGSSPIRNECLWVDGGDASRDPDHAQAAKWPRLQHLIRRRAQGRIRSLSV